MDRAPPLALFEPLNARTRPDKAFQLSTAKPFFLRSKIPARAQKRSHGTPGRIEVSAALDKTHFPPQPMWFGMVWVHILPSTVKLSHLSNPPTKGPCTRNGEAALPPELPPTRCPGLPILTPQHPPPSATSPCTDHPPLSRSPSAAAAPPNRQRPQSACPRWSAPESRSATAPAPGRPRGAPKSRSRPSSAHPPGKLFGNQKCRTDEKQGVIWGGRSDLSVLELRSEQMFLERSGAKSMALGDLCSQIHGGSRRRKPPWGGALFEPGHQAVRSAHDAHRRVADEGPGEDHGGQPEAVRDLQLALLDAKGIPAGCTSVVDRGGHTAATVRIGQAPFEGFGGTMPLLSPLTSSPPRCEAARQDHLCRGLRREGRQRSAGRGRRRRVAVRGVGARGRHAAPAAAVGLGGCHEGLREGEGGWGNGWRDVGHFHLAESQTTIVSTTELTLQN